MDGYSIARFIRQAALSVAGVALITLVMTRVFPTLPDVNAVLLYLLVVLLSATLFGLWPAILASFLAFLSFNFFFVPPLHTFTVADTRNLLSLATFLLVAVITSSLASWARSQRDTAARRAGELAALYRLSQASSAEVDLERSLPLVAEATARLLNAPACEVLLHDATGRLLPRAAYGAADERQAGAADVALRAGRETLGVLRLWRGPAAPELTPAQQTLMRTIAALVVQLLERARLVDEVSRVRAEAESERMKAVLLSSVSHDLRTPLAVIKTAITDLLDADVPREAPAQRELLGIVDAEADRLNRLVGNLLDMSRLEAGAPPPSRSPQALDELAGEVVQRLRHQLASRPVTIAIPDDLPLAQINYTQIDQVLTNLLENALKYTPEGTPIVIRAREQGDALQVEVCDAGPGILPGMEQRIFEKFVRAAGPERHAEGAGLGLAICKGIIEGHGGRIWATNRPEGGACFSFTLPRARQPAPLASQEVT